MMIDYRLLFSGSLFISLSATQLLFLMQCSRQTATTLFAGMGWVGRRCWINLQCRGVLLVWTIVGQGPIALALGAWGVFGNFFSRPSFLLSFSLSLGDGLI